MATKFIVNKTNTNLIMLEGTIVIPRTCFLEVEQATVETNEVLKLKRLGLVEIYNSLPDGVPEQPPSPDLQIQPEPDSPGTTSFDEAQASIKSGKRTKVNTSEQTSDNNLDQTAIPTSN